MQLAEAIERYRAEADSMTQKQKAEAEREIWALYMQTPIVNHGRRREWLTENVRRQDSGGYDIRAMMLGHGEDVAKFWEFVEARQLTTFAMTQMFMRARERHNRQDIPLSDALDAVMQDPTSASQPRQSQPRKKTSKPQVRKPPPRKEVDLSEPSGSRDFWGKIRDFATQFVDQRLEDLDEVERTRVVREFGVEIKVAVDRLFAQINMIRSKERGALLNKMAAKMRWACEILDVPKPHNGKFNFAIAKSKYRSLSSAFHPDKNGSESAKDRYREVQEAYSIIQAWGTLNGREPTKERKTAI